MKHVLRAITLLAVVLASAAGLAGLAPRQASADVARNSGVTSDYAIAMIAPSASCGVALSKRTGHWFCPIAGAQAGAQAGATPQETGKCLAWGCWDVLNPTTSEFSGAGIYGFGGKRLGEAKFFFKIVLRGYQSVSTVRFISTGAVSSLVMTGERLYWDRAHPECHEDSPSTFGSTSFGPIPADRQRVWPGKGYVAYEKTVHLASVLHGWDWKVADYPGDWYLYVKCVKFLRNDEDKGYRYETADHLCAIPVAAGWSPE